MKLILAIVRDTDDEPVINQLVSQGLRVTRVASTGGFLRRGNVTLMIGVEDDKLEMTLDLLRKACCPPEPNQHRATLFVVNAPYFEQI
jgi:uncharacterized protein YaaQ